MQNSNSQNSISLLTSMTLTVLARNRCIGHILNQLWSLGIMFVKSLRMSIFIVAYTRFLILYTVIEV